MSNFDPPITPSSPIDADSGAKRSKSRVTLAVATVAVVLAGAFGVLALVNSGGAKSAEDAVHDLFDALDQEDGLGVLASLDPGERDTLQPAVEDMVDELQRVNVLSDGSSGGGGGNKGGSGPEARLDKVSGVDLQVKDLTLRATPLGDGVTSVEVTGGTISVDAVVDELPLGPLVREAIVRHDVENNTDTTTADLSGLRLVATDDDGWHVSLLYTLGELIRHDMDPQPPIPEFGKGVPAVGASSPEDAVRQAVAAATELDIEKLIGLTPMDGLEALHDYAPGWADAVKGNRSNVTVEGLELTTKDGPDGTKIVSPTAFTIRNSDDYGSFAVVHDGDCTTVTEKVEPDEWDPEGYDSTQKMCGRDDPFGTPTAFLGLNVARDSDGFGIVTEQHDGKWFIDPTTTLVSSLVDALKATTDEDAQRAVWAFSGSWWLLHPDDMWKACGVERPAIDASPEVGEDAENRCFEQLPDDYDGFGGGFLSPRWAYTAGSDMDGYEVSATESNSAWHGDDDLSPELQSCLDAANSVEAEDACFEESEQGSGEEHAPPMTELPSPPTTRPRSATTTSTTVVAGT